MVTQLVLSKFDGAVAAHLNSRASRGPIDVNGGSGALFLDGQEKLIGVMALDTAGSQITNIRDIVNPDKQAHLGPVADLNSLLEFARR